MTYIYAIGIFFCGMFAGIMVTIFCTCAKITDLQEQINSQCETCSYKLLNHPQRERMGSVTRR